MYPFMMPNRFDLMIQQALTSYDYNNIKNVEIVFLQKQC